MTNREGAKMNSKMNKTGSEGSETIKLSDLKKFLIECFCAVGLKRTHSETKAESLIHADLTGKHSHGVFRLDRFIADSNKGSVEFNGEPVIVKETPASAWVDGRNSLGAVVGTFCMKIAIEKAKQVGAAIVSAKNSNNFGVASFYSKQALKEGLLGFCFTNSSPLMVPTRGKEALTGTNPLSLAAPGLSGDFFLLDMATTIASGGNIEIKYHEGEFLPTGWAVNAAGLPETNPDVALKSSRFLPLGSSEELGSYKGSGLSIMIDILCGILGGTNYSKTVNVWIGRLRQQRAGTGHCFIVINPKMFAPNFEDRLSELMSHLRSMETEDPSKPVRIPGDRGREIMKEIEKNGGITYPKYVVDIMKKVAIDLKINCVPFIPKEEKTQKASSEDLASRSEAGESGTASADIQSLGSRSLEEKEEEMSLVLDDSSDWICPIDGTSIERMREERISEYLRGTAKKGMDVFQQAETHSEQRDVGKVGARKRSAKDENIFTPQSDQTREPED